MTSTLRAAACTLALAALALASCGGSSSNPQGTGGTSGGSGSSGGGSGGGGSGSGSGGTGGGTSGGSGGGGTSGGSGAGGGSGSGGTGGGGSGGGATDVCAGLVPSFPSGVEVRFDTGTHATCTVATSNAGGDVALGFDHATTGGYVHLYSSSGVSADSSSGGIALLQDWVSDLPDAWFLPVASGWRGIVHDPPPAMGVRTWDPHGVSGPGGTYPDVNASWLAPTPGGDTVVLGNRVSDGASRLVWLDASGATTRFDVGLGPGTFKAAIVAWATGHVLVLSGNDAGSGTAWARWYDGQGAPLTAAFDTHVALPTDYTGNKAVALRGLLDGSVVLYDGSAYAAAFTDGQAGTQAVPGWLSSRPGKRLLVRPNGKGYVMLPLAPVPTGATGAPDGELLAPDGTSCGALTAPTAAPPPGADARVTEALFVGQDGTVFARDSLTGAGLGSGIHCAWRWWPGVLQ